MTRFSFVIMLAAGLSAQTAYAQSADSLPGDAYLDRAAADHVRLARAHRQIADLSVQRYSAVSKERMSIGLRGLRRDRLLFRREVAGRIDWTRNGPGRIEVLGAREVVPVANTGIKVPDDLDAFMPHLAFDPADTRLMIGWDDDEFVRHPFAPGAEQHYRYRTGGTTTIHLPDGRAVRLVELEILPRTRDPKSITGSFWLESETHSTVRAAFRVARDIDIRRDLNEDDEDIPKFLDPMTITIDHVTIEYGLYELKWWMPRSVLFEGAVRVAIARMPLQYERTYSNYQIEGGAAPVIATTAELRAQREAQRAQTDSCRTKVTVHVDTKTYEPKPGAQPDTVRSVTQCGRWQIVMPADSSAMIHSRELPADIFAAGEQLVSEAELRELGKEIEKLGGGPPLLPEPVVSADLLKLRHARYNRVEGLSIGAVGSVDYGAYRAHGLVRIGVADLEPNAELAVQRLGQHHTLELRGFRRLNGMDPFSTPFSPGSSLSALLFGRDDADYYRAYGAELNVFPRGSAANWYDLRLFVQRESAATKETDFSIRNLLGDVDFRSNLPATRGTWYGIENTLRYSRGLDPDGFRIGMELFTHGAAGTSRLARTAATLRLGVPLPGPLAGALEGAAGVTSVGAPVQHNWFLGGPNTLRGYAGSTLSGETFWRGRAEIGYGLPALRLVAFSDAGWAGARDRFETGKPLLSAGAGISVLDGILRFDVARGLRAPKGWTTTLYFDAAL